MAVKFPSLEFFRELQRLMNADRPRFQKLGVCDTTLGISVAGADSHLYALRFEVFECVDVRELASERDADLDFVLEAPVELWRGMLESIRRNGRADPEFTLNSLSHLGDRMKVRYDDPEGHDKFYRFMGTLQAFFDQAAGLRVEAAS
jgi:hypothetical protein